MTVAAVVLVPDLNRARADADGEPALRRVVRAAWAGGALPVVVVAPGPADGSDDVVAGLVADLPAVLAHPPAEIAPGARWFAFGLAAAADAVTETTAAMLWPVRCAWVDPETVTSLVEAHGAAPDAIVRPAYDGQPGFPIVIPAVHAARLGAEPELHGWQVVDLLAAEGVPVRIVELGDPGIVHDISTARADLPAYQGPPQPAGGPPPDWNAALAAQADRQSVAEGPSLAPYGQAGSPTPDEPA